eukprot:12002083-Alexandrium_andersonii.AAC.1
MARVPPDLGLAGLAVARQPDSSLVRLLARAAKTLQREGAGRPWTLRGIRIRSRRALGSRCRRWRVRNREVGRDTG